jgi:hypothetical protein
MKPFRHAMTPLRSPFADAKGAPPRDWVEPESLAEAIIRAGARARGEVSGAPEPISEAAAAILRAGKRRRNEI